MRPLPKRLILIHNVDSTLPPSLSKPVCKNSDHARPARGLESSTKDLAVDHQLVDMQSHLQGDQVPVALDSHSVSKPKEEDADSAEEHSTTEEVAEVHPLGHPATDKHEDGVREQVGGVKDGQHVLGFCCTCSINLEVWRHKGDL